MDIFQEKNVIIFTAKGGYDIGKEIAPSVVKFTWDSSQGEIRPRASWFTVELEGNNYRMIGHILYALFTEGGEVQPLFTLAVTSHFTTDIYYTGLEHWKDITPGEEALVGEYEVITKPEEPPNKAEVFRMDGSKYNPSEPAADTNSGNGDSSTKGEE